ncbi:oxidative stress-induced growth inhibitor 2-like [Oppia nitens]|uniref:oxidative stress-induced growth inhibitor 2-like n=1 Tax=Oppia nitens TaxID=1686743 RepID=UPI0023DB4A47|nr:oxidative stress-induced growth inhibitor 2-like [Oppia nitens]
MNSVNKEVVIIGNGPSAITLSYMLSGNWPFYKKDQTLNPNEFLHQRLIDDSVINKSLVEQDLEYLSDGLEGRSINKVSLLLDQLQHPEADFGVENPSTLQWKYFPDKAIDHVVIGKGLPGGAWHSMNDCKEILTISLGSWMQLPDMEIREWCSQHRRESRVSLSTVANYYYNYVKNKDLMKNFKHFSTVTSVRFDRQINKYQIDGYDSNGDEFKYQTPRVVLATGNCDRINRLGVPGEDLPFVLHSLNELEQLIAQSKVKSTTDPILIVGAGLSAADAVIAARFRKVPIIHAFRRHPEDPALIFNQLPENMYPEYHSVHSKMKAKSLSSSGYEALPMHCVKEIKSNKEVILVNRIGVDDTCLTTSVKIKVSYVLVLIGMKPNLTFVEKDLLCNLGIKKNEDIFSRSNPIAIDTYTHESLVAPGLYAMGPIIGDNFVRFVQGGALAITNHIHQQKLSLC